MTETHRIRQVVPSNWLTATVENAPYHKALLSDISRSIENILENGASVSKFNSRDIQEEEIRQVQKYFASRPDNAKENYGHGAVEVGSAIWYQNGIDAALIGLITEEKLPFEYLDCIAQSIKVKSSGKEENYSVEDKLNSKQYTIQFINQDAALGGSFLHALYNDQTDTWETKHPDIKEIYNIF